MRDSPARRSPRPGGTSASAVRAASASETSRCWVPSCRSRSIRRRAWSEAATIRRREAGQLRPALRVRDRGGEQLGELLQASLHTKRQKLVGGRNVHRTPQTALDNDRGRDRADDTQATCGSRDGPAGRRPVHRVDTGGTSGAVDLRRRHSGLELPSRPDPDIEGLRDADEDDRRPVAGEPEDHRLRPEQASDLVADGREDLDGRHAARHQRGHPPQRGLLLGDQAEPGVQLGVIQGDGELASNELDRFQPSSGERAADQLVFQQQDRPQRSPAEDGQGQQRAAVNVGEVRVACESVVAGDVAYHQRFPCPL